MGDPLMRAAIYARYSSDQQSAASIPDQVRLCRRLCDEQGWEGALPPVQSAAMRLLRVWLHHDQQQPLWLRLSAQFRHLPESQDGPAQRC